MGPVEILVIVTILKIAYWVEWQEIKSNSSGGGLYFDRKLSKMDKTSKWTRYEDSEIMDGAPYEVKYSLGLSIWWMSKYKPLVHVSPGLQIHLS